MTGAARTAASKLLTAPELPAATATLVLHGQQVGLQVHESIGQALELDRIVVGEASYAGTSWIAPGDLRYGSEQLTITADATLPGAWGRLAPTHSEDGASVASSAS